MNFFNRIFAITAAILFSLGVFFATIEPILTLIDSVIAWNWLAGEILMIMMVLILVGLVYSSLLHIPIPVLALPIIFTGVIFAGIFALISVCLFLPSDVVTVLSFVVGIPFMLCVAITLCVLVVRYYKIHPHK